MSQHPTERTSAPTWLAPAIPRTEPDALLHVKLITPDKEPAPLSPWLRRFMVAAIVLGFLYLILWGTYVYPRAYPPPTNFPSLSIALIQPAYVAPGDEADLDVTVTNSSTDPITGTVAVVFEGSAAAHPAPLEEAFISFDGLAGGASLTRRIRFSICQAPTFFCQDMIRLSLQAAVGGQCVRFPVESQIAVAPVPYIKKVISFLSSSAITAAVATFLWDEIKKRLLGAEGK